MKKEVTIRLTEKMNAAVEAFKELWKHEYSSEEEVVKELLKNGIEHYMESIESEKEEYEIITKVMKSKGYTGKRIWDME
jgi:metal-responsive CopG/Arc/MetJ family transcriptional regulator